MLVLHTHVGNYLVAFRAVPAAEELLALLEKALLLKRSPGPSFDHLGRRIEVTPTSSHVSQVVAVGRLEEIV